MKVIAIVKVPKLQSALRALAAFPIEAPVVEEVRGYGRQKGHLELYQGSEYTISFLPKVRIQFHAPPEIAEAAAWALVEASRTGRIGDGKVFLLDDVPVPRP